MVIILMTGKLILFTNFLFLFNDVSYLNKLDTVAQHNARSSTHSILWTNKMLNMYISLFQMIISINKCNAAVRIVKSLCISQLGNAAFSRVGKLWHLSLSGVLSISRY